MSVTEIIIVLRNGREPCYIHNDESTRWQTKHYGAVRATRILYIVFPRKMKLDPNADRLESQACECLEIFASIAPSSLVAPCAVAVHVC
jgi:hypothetical protein